MSTCIEIPLQDTDEVGLTACSFRVNAAFAKKNKCLQVIEVDPDQLPECSEVFSILLQERAPLHVWVNVAVCGNRAPNGQYK